MKKVFFIFISLSISNFLLAQEKVKDTLETDEIIVIKPYTPTISDAFKIKDNPETNQESFKKEKTAYSSLSIPVVSTFTPTKGKAQSIEKEPAEKIYENFIAAGFGNYSTAYFETFMHSSSSNFNDFGVYLKLLSSSGGVDNTLVETDYSNTQLNLFYKQFERDYNWEIVGGLEHNNQYWYGFPTDIVFDPILIESIDAQQKFLNVFTGGNISFEDGIFQTGTISLNHFSDNYGSGEIHTLITSDFEFPVTTEQISTEASLEYISGSFDNGYATTNGLDHSFLNIGAHPNFEILRDDLSISLGAKVYYSFDFENSNNQFYFYPNINASYKLIDRTLIVFGGVTGDLEQNSYQKYTIANPYISPTLTILQTDKQYDAFIGAKGKLTSAINYNLRAGYQNENDKPLFINNPSLTDGTMPVTNSYDFGNSFGVVYDDIQTLLISAEMNIEVSKEFNLSGTIEFKDYTTTNQSEAWNLPTIKSIISANYTTPNWYLSSDIFLVGERKDIVSPAVGFPMIKTLDSYIDLNFNGGYIFTDRLTAFAKVNNALSSNYERFTNFEVQGFQIIAGVIYKFNL